MSCILPGARRPGHVLGATSSTASTPSPRSRPTAGTGGTYFDADRTAKDKIYSRWGGFIDDVPFDPVAYGMPPNSLRSIEPLQLLALATATAALADAGYAERPFARERTSVILGAGGGGASLGIGYTVRSTPAAARSATARRR